MAPNDEVYSMRKGSWKLISPQTFPSHITVPKGHQNHICVEDHLHWLCVTNLESKPQTILAFDLGEKAFIETPLPEAILDVNVCKFPIVIGVLSDTLCVMSCVDVGKCEVWVMDKYGVPQSCVKHKVITSFSGDIEPFGFTSQGEFLFQVGINDDGFGLYDPVAAKTEARNYSEMRIVEYVDSLVWVPPPNREIICCNISQFQIGK